MTITSSQLKLARLNIDNYNATLQTISVSPDACFNKTAFWPAFLGLSGLTGVGAATNAQAIGSGSRTWPMRVYDMLGRKQSWSNSARQEYLNSLPLPREKEYRDKLQKELRQPSPATNRAQAQILSDAQYSDSVRLRQDWAAKVKANPNDAKVVADARKALDTPRRTAQPGVYTNYHSDMAGARTDYIPFDGGHNGFLIQPSGTPNYNPITGSMNLVYDPKSPGSATVDPGITSHEGKHSTDGRTWVGRLNGLRNLSPFEAWRGPDVIEYRGHGAPQRARASLLYGDPDKLTVEEVDAFYQNNGIIPGKANVDGIYTNSNYAEAPGTNYTNSTFGYDPKQYRRTGNENDPDISNMIRAEAFPKQTEERSRRIPNIVSSQSDDSSDLLPIEDDMVQSYRK